jgi:hypothetical protein
MIDIVALSDRWGARCKFMIAVRQYLYVFYRSESWRKKSVLVTAVRCGELQLSSFL